MKRKNDKNEDENKFIPKEKPILSKRFIPRAQEMGYEANPKSPFVPLTVEDALARRENKDK